MAESDKILRSYKIDCLLAENEMAELLTFGR
jgi:hypothetical protein